MWGSGLTYTRLANLAAMVYLCLKSLAHLDPRYLAASLLFNAMSPMFVRAGPLNSMLVDEAKQCGMSVGQLCGARDSLRAVSMMVAPLLYSRVYGWARRFRGAPYLCGAALMAVSQCCLLGVTCEAAHESPEARFDMLIEAIGDISEGEELCEDYVSDTTPCFNKITPNLVFFSTPCFYFLMIPSYFRKTLYVGVKTQRNSW